jgi:hypothetical protein
MKAATSFWLQAAESDHKAIARLAKTEKSSGLKRWLTKKPCSCSDPLVRAAWFCMSESPENDQAGSSRQWCMWAGKITIETKDFLIVPIGQFF